MLQFSKSIGAAVANLCGAMEARDHFKNGASSKSQMSRVNFFRLWTKVTILVFLIAQLSVMISCSSEKMFIQNEEFEWWQPILEKHNLQLGAYNNFGNIFEWGMEGNSINNGICTLRAATVIVKYNDTYVLIEADTIHHNIKEGVLEIISGVGKAYNMNSELPDVVLTGLTKMKVGRKNFDFIASESMKYRFN